MDELARRDRAIGYYEAALAVRLQSSAAHNNLGLRCVPSRIGRGPWLPTAKPSLSTPT
jgi:hypothetical protein